MMCSDWSCSGLVWWRFAISTTTSLGVFYRVPTYVDLFLRHWVAQFWTCTMMMMTSQKKNLIANKLGSWSRSNMVHFRCHAISSAEHMPRLGMWESHQHMPGSGCVRTIAGCSLPYLLYLSTQVGKEPLQCCYR